MSRPTEVGSTGSKTPWISVSIKPPYLGHPSAALSLQHAENLSDIVAELQKRTTDIEPRILLTGLPLLAWSHRKSPLHQPEREESRLAIRGNPQN
jgi:hypothetical protein